MEMIDLSVFGSVIGHLSPYLTLVLGCGLTNLLEQKGLYQPKQGDVFVVSFQASDWSGVIIFCCHWLTVEVDLLQKSARPLRETR